MSAPDNPLDRSEEEDEAAAGRNSGTRNQRAYSPSQPTSLLQKTAGDADKPASPITDGEALQPEWTIEPGEIWDFALIFVKNPIGSVVLIAMIAVPLYLAWPVSLYLALTCIALFAAWIFPRESAWRKAAISVLFPASVGFALVIVMLLLMSNFLVHTDMVTFDYVITYSRLNWIDFALLKVHETVEVR
jgi:hypothetical protein